MLNIIKIFIVIIILSKSIFANTQGAAPALSALNSKVLDEVFTTLGQYNKSSVEFLQTNPDNTTAQGMLLIEKPYNFRCNYYEPYPLLIISSKNYTSVYDYSMEEISRISMKDNPLNFLLSDINTFKKLYTVNDIKVLDQYYIVKISFKNLSAVSEIKFNRVNKSIDVIKFFDEENNLTIVELFNTKKVQKFSPELFIIKNPQIFGPAPRFSADQLKKYIKY